MLTILKNLLGGQAETGSKDVAKERLRLVLLHDRASVSPQYLDLLKGDMIKTVSNYMEISEQDMEVSLTREDQKVTLVANIPVNTMKRPQILTEQAEEEQAAAVLPVAALPSQPPVEDEESDFFIHGI